MQALFMTHIRPADNRLNPMGKSSIQTVAKCFMLISKCLTASASWKWHPPCPVASQWRALTRLFNFKHGICPDRFRAARAAGNVMDSSLPVARQYFFPFSWNDKPNHNNFGTGEVVGRVAPRAPPWSGNARRARSDAPCLSIAKMNASMLL